MKIAVIGGTGLLGSNLLKQYRLRGYDVRAFSREQSYNVDNRINTTIDFNYLENELNKYFNTWKPDMVINTVANVNLQQCEEDYSSANYVNCEIAKKVAKVANRINTYFIQISTDHYFNDFKSLHTEKEKVLLLNNYSKTKYNAEENVLKIKDDSFVIRTNIIGYRRRTAKSFFEWLVDSLETQEKINLFSNFYTSSIDINSLSKVLIMAYEKRLYGIYNVGCSEVISKYDFGLKVAKRFGFSIKNIIKSDINNNQATVKRALTLGLDVSKIENELNIKMPTINEVIDSLYDEFKEMRNEQ